MELSMASTLLSSLVLFLNSSDSTSSLNYLCIFLCFICWISFLSCSQCLYDQYRKQNSTGQHSQSLSNRVFTDMYSRANRYSRKRRNTPTSRTMSRVQQHQPTREGEVNSGLVLLRWARSCSLIITIITIPLNCRNGTQVPPNIQILLYSTYMKFLLSASHRLYMITGPHNNRRLHLLPLKLVDSYIYNSDTLVVLSHKTLTLYECNEKHENTAFKVAHMGFHNMFAATFAKKAETCVFKPNGIYASDKYGDIFVIQNKQSQFLNENFAIPRFLHYAAHGDRQYLIVADEYSKLKIFNANNLQQILNIWIPFTCTPLQMLTLNPETLLYLCRIDKKDNNNCHFELYTLQPSQLEEEDFPGVKIAYQSQSSSQNLQSKIVKLNDQSFAVVSLMRSEIFVDIYQCHNKSIEHARRAKMEITKGDWQGLDVVYEHDKEELLVMYGIEGQAQPIEQIKLTKEYNQISPNEEVAVFKLN